MRFIIGLLLVLLYTSQPAMSDNQPPLSVTTGDIEAIQARGTLRLLEPYMAGDLFLPRNFIPLSQYRDQAELFAASLGVKAEWLRAESIPEVIDMLNDGKGDLVVSNLTNTELRQQSVAFSQPLKLIDEWLIYAKNKKKPDLKKESLILAVPDGTSYLETVNSIAAKNKAITVRILPADLSDSESMEGVSNGAYDATIVDSDMAEVLLQNMDDLSHTVVREHREIAWALRKDNPRLKKHLNEFLTTHYIESKRNAEIKQNWQAIKETGTLRMITMNSPVSYFMWRNELVGFDYHLLQAFAKKHKLRLQLVVKDSPEALIDALKNGEGDVIAASLTRTSAREAMGLVFTEPYLMVTEQLVSYKHSEPLTDKQQLAGLKVSVNPHSSFYSSLQALQKEGIEVGINPVEGVNSEDLISSVLSGQYAYTIADSHMVDIERTWNDSLNVLFDVSDKRPIAWVLRPDQSQLKKKLNAYLAQIREKNVFASLKTRYFERKQTIIDHYKERLKPGEAISPYDALFRKYAEKHEFDWLLITSQAYQESRFDPKARSFAGATGLMQLMPKTARSLGFKNLKDPDVSVNAGTTYMQWLRERLVKQLPVEESLFFSLASYNAGYGHVQDARRLARQLGMDQDVWFDNVEKAMLLLSKKKYHSKARYGYVRGKEPVHYVRAVRERYLAYVEATRNQISALENIPEINLNPQGFR